MSHEPETHEEKGFVLYHSGLFSASIFIHLTFHTVSTDHSLLKKNHLHSPLTGY